MQLGLEIYTVLRILGSYMEARATKLNAFVRQACGTEDPSLALVNPE